MPQPPSVSLRDTVVMTLATVAVPILASVIGTAVGLGRVSGIVGTLVFTLAAEILLLWLLWHRVVRHVPGHWQGFGFADIGFRDAGQALGWVLLIRFGLGFALLALPAEEVARSTQMMQQIVAPDGMAATALVVFLIVVAAPIVEEGVFRGLLYRWVREHASVAAGTLVSSAVFAGIHFYFLVPGGPIGWVQTAGIFALGAICCRLSERSGSLTPAVFAHAVWNAITLIGLKLV